MRVGAASTVDLRDLRIAGGVLLAGAAVIPLLPGPGGLPCPLRSLTGIPCPLCGMTTSVTAAVHLDPLAAVAANPAGLLAVLVALGLLVFRGRRQVRVPQWALPIALVAMELWQLARFGLL
ncbi:MAG TPA: DUF2752 domain-containing protein [Acidimicrobiales bacterium]|nr:DUF2752 domain-containing protein [Acidimicrobiales bacterium]